MRFIDNLTQIALSIFIDYVTFAFKYSTILYLYISYIYTLDLHLLRIFLYSAIVKMIQMHINVLII